MKIGHETDSIPTHSIPDGCGSELMVEITGKTAGLFSEAVVISRKFSHLNGKPFWFPTGMLKPIQDSFMQAEKQALKTA